MDDVPANRDDFTPSPTRLFDTLIAYWQTEAMKAAIELDLFTALGRKSRTAGELAERCGANEAGIRRLCDFLAALGLVRNKSGRYRSAPDAARYLDRQSPESLASMVGFYTTPPVTDAFANVAAAVRRGGTVLENEGLLKPGTAAWVEFAQAVWPLRRIEAEIVADTIDEFGLARGRVLDLGCGGSPLGIALAQRNRRLLIVAQDWPDVVAIAARHARRAGVAGRLTTLAGDARTIDRGGPYDDGLRWRQNHPYLNTYQYQFIQKPSRLDINKSYFDINPYNFIFNQSRFRLTQSYLDIDPYPFRLNPSSFNLNQPHGL